MNQLSTLALLMGNPTRFYERKCTPYEKGCLGGGVLRTRKLKRIEEIRPKMIEMLKSYQLYIKGDPEFKRLASLYIKVGGYRPRKSG